MDDGIVIITTKHLDRGGSRRIEVDGHVPRDPAKQREALRAMVRDVHPDAEIQSYNRQTKVAGFIARDHFITARVERVSSPAPEPAPAAALF